MTRYPYLLPLLTLLTISLLGAADLVAPKREATEWFDVWVTQGDKPQAKPRVLLIGDSITRGYYSDAQKGLKGMVCDRLATSASLGDPLLIQQVELIVRQYHYDVVHVNNGMHGWDYSEAEYAAAIPTLLATLRQVAPDAKLIWATTTPNAGAPTSDKNQRISARNRLVVEALKGTDVVIDDLHAVIAADPTLIKPDHVHMTPAGSAALGAQVARVVGAVLGAGGK